MNAGPANPNPPSPVNIDEADLLALIEGTPLPAERAAHVRQALTTDPCLAELAALMRADRDAIASLPVAAAPADLLDRVETLLERDALVGLARTEAAMPAGDLPISAVVPRRRPLLTLRTGAPLAAAAAVLLIAGGVLMLIPAKRPLKPAPASTDSAAVPAGNNTSLANNTAPPDATSPDPDPVAQPADLARGDQPEPANPAPRPVTVAAIPPAIDPAQLLAAATEGRLVLRLRAPADRAVGRVSALQANSRGIHVEPMSEAQRSEAARAYVGSVSAHRKPPEVVKPLPDRPEPGPIAGHDAMPAPHPAPAVAVEARPAPAGEPDPVVAEQAYVAVIPATPDALLALRAAIDNATVAADWQVLDQPLALEAPPDAAAVLWWTGAPSTWSRRCAVPIIVQTN